MKKITALIMSIMFLLGAIGCVPNTDLSLTLDTSCWSNKTNASEKYEKCVYNVERVDVRTNTTVASGTLTYVIDFDHNVNELYYLSLSTDFSLTYNDNAPQADRGKTDTITSKTVFLGSALVPKSVDKKVVLAPRDGVVNDSYELSTNYETYTSTLTFTSKDAPVSTLNFKDNYLNEVYESDMLLYVVRAFKQLVSNGTRYPFSVVNMFDCHTYDKKFATTPMTFYTNATGEEEAMAFPSLSSYLDEQGSLMAIKTTISINKQNSGPAIIAKYSKTPFKLPDGSENEKVLVYYETQEYDVVAKEKSYVNKYTLSSYAHEE